MNATNVRVLGGDNYSNTPIIIIIIITDETRYPLGSWVLQLP
jgi:hypothetical protein